MTATEVVREPDGTVDIRLKTTTELKILCKALNTLADEVTLEVDQDGVACRFMDPSHVAMIDLYWPNSGFERYECTGKTKIAVMMDEFSKFLEDFKDYLSIEIDDENHVVLSDRELTVAVNRIEASASSTPLPKLSYYSKVKMACKAFTDTMKTIRKMGEYIEIHSVDGRVTFNTRGGFGTTKRMFEAGSEGLEELVVREESKATFSLDYLEKFHKAMTTGKDCPESVTFEYSSKMPIRLEYRIANVGRIHFYLAPRVQD